MCVQKDRRSRGGTEVKERKTLLWGTEQAGYSTKTWKGEPVNGRTSHQMTDMETEQGMYRELTGKNWVDVGITPGRGSCVVIRCAGSCFVNSRITFRALLFVGAKI